MRQRVRDDADKQRAHDPGAAMERCHVGPQPNEKRQTVDSEGENPSAEQVDPEHAEDKSNDKTFGISR